MNINELPRVVSDLLLLVIPGFIALRIEEKFSLKKRHKNQESFYLYLLYSFVIKLCYSILVSVVIMLDKNWGLFLKKETVGQFGYILLSIPLGLILVRFQCSLLGRRVYKRINKYMSPEPSVWIKAMQNERGAWATVYLKNGMIYTGKLRYYSNDPNEKERAILLYQYRLSIRNNGKISKPEDYCLDIVNHFEDEETKVYLNATDIISVEIIP